LVSCKQTLLQQFGCARINWSLDESTVHYLMDLFPKSSIVNLRMMHGKC
jgi:hypothetical protein